MPPVARRFSEPFFRHYAVFQRSESTYRASLGRTLRGQCSVGFLELSLRSYAEGTDDSPVPYVEGWFVQADTRGKGAGKALMENAMDWASSQGFAHLASDTDLSNEGSIRAHHAAGFKEVGRQVAFLRPLKPQN